MRSSAGLISTSSTSSSSGRIATVPADDAADDLLVAAVLARAFAEHLHRESPAFRVARVHAVQVTGEDRRLIAPGTGAHLEEDVPVIARILRQQEPAQLAL